MALQLGATREAFLLANVPADKANAAAEELAAYNDQIANMRGDIKLVRWVVVGLYPLVTAILLKLPIP
jgi:hypothetical protein